MSKDVDPGLFRETLGHYPTGVAVVTALLDEGTPAGMVVGTFSSVSLDPPLVAFFPMKGSKSFAVIRNAKAFCINVLASDQEQACRQLATGGASKFDGLTWREGPLGSPILADAVCWIECLFEETREAGDHYIVLGRVQEFALERSTLPLLFFQGGYGRFTPGSFVAAPAPDLIQAAQFAEGIRAKVEKVSDEFGVNCSVLAKIGWDAVQVLAANSSPHAENFPLGHRQPLVPPFGAVFMVQTSDEDVEQWMRRAPDDSPERRGLNEAVLNKVRERGYSLLTAKPEVMQRHDALLAAFERSERLPRQERVVRQAASDLTEHFAPDLVPGRRYDIATIVVLLPQIPGLPPMSIRMTGLAQDAPTEQIESWIDALKRVAASSLDEAGVPA